MTSISAKATDIVVRTARRMLDARNSLELEAIKTEVGLEIAQQAWYQLGDGEKAIVSSTAKIGATPGSAKVRDRVLQTARRMLNASSGAELKAIKTEVGAELANKAWRSMEDEERSKIKAIAKIEQALLFPVEAPDDPSSWELQPAPSRAPLELGWELAAIDAALDAWDEESLPEDSGPLLALKNLLDRCEETDRAYKNKLDDVASLIRNRELMAEARAAEAQRLQQLAEADRALAERLKARLQRHLEERGIQRVNTLRHQITLATDSAKRSIHFADTPLPELPQRFQDLGGECEESTTCEVPQAGEQLPFASWEEPSEQLKTE